MASRHASLRSKTVSCRGGYRLEWESEKRECFCYFTTYQERSVFRTIVKLLKPKEDACVLSGKTGHQQQCNIGCRISNDLKLETAERLLKNLGIFYELKHSHKCVSIFSST